MFTTDYPGENRITIKAVGGRMTAKRAVLKYFSQGSVKEGLTSKQRKMNIIGGTYAVETVIVERVGSQHDFEVLVRSAAEKLSRKRHAMVWDVNDHWGFVADEKFPFNDVIPF